MSRDASIELEFGGEVRAFRLPIGRWRQIQEKCDAGPQELLRRYILETWRVDDVREVIRQGLIGAAGPVADTGKIDTLMRREFDDLPLLPFVKISQAIVMASLIGAPDEDDPPPKGEQGESGAGDMPISPAASSTSAPSTAKPRRSRTRSVKSTA